MKKPETSLTEAARKAIEAMPEGCHACHVLREGNCNTFNRKAGNAATQEAALKILAAEKPVEVNSAPCPR